LRFIVWSFLKARLQFTSDQFNGATSIYVAEVANTYWPILFGTKPDHELRSLQKLVRVS
jgi:hypothetical protein